MKKLIAALVLGAMLVTIGIGCGNPSTPTKTPEKPKDSTEKPKTGT